MKKRTMCAVLTSVAVAAAAASTVWAANTGAIRLRARLTGFQEVPPKLTNATGRFTAVVDPTRTSVTFVLTYSDLSSPVLFSHIHFGQRGVNGGVMVFFCNNTPTGPQPRACPSRGGTISGTFTARDVIGPGPDNPATDQGISPGNLRQVIRAILSGETYVNVHSQRFPSGEIRGKVNVVSR
jgi:hypothetical protein